MLAYLALMDVGVVALVPREVAFAVGQGHGADSDQVRALIGRTLGVVSCDYPDYKIEWWYYTGNLASNDGKRFGYQLTFFRVGVEPRRQILRVGR